MSLNKGTWEQKNSDLHVLVSANKTILTFVRRAPNDTDWVDMRHNKLGPDLERAKALAESYIPLV